MAITSTDVRSLPGARILDKTWKQRRIGDGSLTYAPMIEKGCKMPGERLFTSNIRSHLFTAYTTSTRDTDHLMCCMCLFSLMSTSCKPGFSSSQKSQPVRQKSMRTGNL